MVQICRNCGLEKDLSEFGKDKRLKLEHKYFCKSCMSTKYNNTRKIWKSKNKDKVKQQNRKYKNKHRKELSFRESLRQAFKIKATPKWANLNNIKEIYKNCPKGYQVDHIIPLRGKDVSGLHVENNLQYLTASENSRKSNRYL
jgi:hypothetical protein